ncbi:uncharacterized protein F5Z01DRAFT_637053 [Emericellopsis atlantica]|uniref:Uncharacterized protein n=1 Tax=Emericellopsis atlantica TaxID=2614577 RepID=A0A9P7ZKK3_9HYPO|nr:uncharacterized protein F5Z01DRAFT_637053 [Emericellopsis atlantica]KAG9253838.1 hypothetical protein F5Z01DRAFT_637053 [Emericellopsis atlantica]
MCGPCDDGDSQVLGSAVNLHEHWRLGLPAPIMHMKSLQRWGITVKAKRQLEQDIRRICISFGIPVAAIQFREQRDFLAPCDPRRWMHKRTNLHVHIATPSTLDPDSLDQDSLEIVPQYCLQLLASYNIVDVTCQIVTSLHDDSNTCKLRVICDPYEGVLHRETVQTLDGMTIKEWLDSRRQLPILGDPHAQGSCVACKLRESMVFKCKAVLRRAYEADRRSHQPWTIPYQRGPFLWWLLDGHLLFAHMDEEEMGIRVFSCSHATLDVVGARKERLHGTTIAASDCMDCWKTHEENLSEADTLVMSDDEDE